MALKKIAVALIFGALAFEFYRLVPKYPAGHENVTLKRQVTGAFAHGFFKLAIWAERFGLIDDSAELIQKLFNMRVAEHPPPEGVNIKHSVISDLKVIIFRPDSADPVSKAIVYFHGGGFTLGSTMSHYSWTLRLANTTSSTVISVDYRLAPRHPFPAALDDCIRVTKAIFDSAESLGIDRNRIAVAGDSAGGNFAAAVAVELAASEKYKLKAQVLISPVLVAAGVSGLPSYVHYGDLFLIHLDWFIVKYAGLSFTSAIEAAIRSEHHISVEQLDKIRHRLNISALPDDILALIPDRAYADTRESGASEQEMISRPKEVEAIGKVALDQRAWPLIFENDAQLKKVAPALVQVCEFDPLRDEGLLYFHRLRSLGVGASVSFLRYAIHAEPLFRDITGATPSTASLKGLSDIVEFIQNRL